MGGVNIQHDLVKSLGIDDTHEDTNKFHDVAGHHAADGAMALIMASVDTTARRNDFYAATRAEDIKQAVYKLDPNTQPDEQKATDPLCESSWPKASRDSFWKQAVLMTGANWSL